MTNVNVNVNESVLTIEKANCFINMGKATKIIDGKYLLINMVIGYDSDDVFNCEDNPLPFYYICKIGEKETEKGFPAYDIRENTTMPQIFWDDTDRLKKAAGRIKKLNKSNIKGEKFHEKLKKIVHEVSDIPIKNQYSYGPYFELSTDIDYTNKRYCEPDDLSIFEGINEDNIDGYLKY